MTENEGLGVQAGSCPVVAAAYRSGDAKVIARMEGFHPPARCAHVKAAVKAEAVPE